jgi:predicted HTH domain antitoxin
MGISFDLPDLNIKEDELRLLLTIKLLEDGTISLGKAAEIAGYSEKAFVEVLIHRGVSPLKYSELDLDREMRNA